MTGSFKLDTCANRNPLHQRLNKVYVNYYWRANENMDTYKKTFWENIGQYQALNEIGRVLTEFPGDRWMFPYCACSSRVPFLCIPAPNARKTVITTDRGSNILSLLDVYFCDQITWLSDDGLCYRDNVVLRCGCELMGWRRINSFKWGIIGWNFKGPTLIAAFVKVTLCKSTGLRSSCVPLLHRIDLISSRIFFWLSGW